MDARSLLLALFLPVAVACGASSDGTTTDDQNLSAQPGELGTMCGGIAGFECKPGLRCELHGNHPDAAGTCEVALPGELGGICGGIGGFECKPGLHCKMPQGNFPDAAGTCEAAGPPPVCLAVPTCDDGDSELAQACQAVDGSCYSRSLCGRTVHCQKAPSPG